MFVSTYFNEHCRVFVEFFGKFTVAHSPHGPVCLGQPHVAKAVALPRRGRQLPSAAMHCIRSEINNYVLRSNYNS